MITVSIVDDEKELCQSIATFVNGASGFRCLSMYHSGEAALEHLTKDRPDVVLMDIHLTGMSGIECAGRLKALMPQIQIMMLTVYEDTDQIFKGVVGGGQRIYAQAINTQQASGSNLRRAWRGLADVQFDRTQGGDILPGASKDQ